MAGVANDGGGAAVQCAHVMYTARYKYRSIFVVTGLLVISRGDSIHRGGGWGGHYSPVYNVQGDNIHR